MSNTRNCKDVKLHLKVVFNKPKTKVLFVEADNHFTDTLLSFLSLPLGKFVQIMKKHYGDEAPFMGSMNTLHSSLLNLDNSYFSTETCKRMLIDPESKYGDECSRMKLDVTDSQPNRYFVCQDYDSCTDRYKHIESGLYYNSSTRCDCGKAISKEVKLLMNPGVGAFTVATSSFLITDNLKIFSNVTASLVQIVSEIGVDVIDWGERINWTFGFDEAMDLLKATIFSLTPLTDIVLHKGKCGFAIPGVEPGGLSHKIESPKFVTHCELKAVVQKSTNRLLFVESEEFFVDFLFSLFVIPLGGIEHLVGGVTPFFKNISNLNSSVEAIDKKYFQFDKIKSKLTKLHNMPTGYLSNFQLLCLSTDCTGQTLFYHRDFSQGKDYLSHSEGDEGFSLRVYPNYYLKQEKYYLKRSGTYKITDDLTVRPLSVLDGLDVPLLDVSVQEVTITSEQALRILMASLTSKSVLSTILGPMLLEKPTQER